MRATAVVVLIGLLSIGPQVVREAQAQAGVYGLTWYSEVFGIDYVTGESVRADIAGQGTARLSVTVSLVTIEFDTPLGPAHLEIQPPQGITSTSRLPFDVPAAVAFDRAGGRRLYDATAWVAGFSPTGANPAAPDTFTVSVLMPGSGPAPEYHFVATGTREVLTSWIVQPSDEATLAGNAAVRMASSGGVGTRRAFRVYVDDALVTSQTVNDDRASYTLNTTAIPNGVHRLGVEVDDGVGSDRTERLVTIANASRMAGVSLSLTSDQTVRGSVPIQVATTGLGAGTKRFYLAIDGRQVDYWVVGTSAITWWFKTLAYVNGTHAVSVRVVDAGGREVTSSVRVVIAN